MLFKGYIVSGSFLTVFHTTSTLILIFKLYDVLFCYNIEPHFIVFLKIGILVLRL